MFDSNQNMCMLKYLIINNPLGLQSSLMELKYISKLVCRLPSFRRPREQLDNNFS